jgi:hypothetical protein
MTFSDDVEQRAMLGEKQSNLSTMERAPYVWMRKSSLGIQIDGDHFHKVVRATSANVALSCSKLDG